MLRVAINSLSLCLRTLLLSFQSHRFLLPLVISPPLSLFLILVLITLSLPLILLLLLLLLFLLLLLLLSLLLLLLLLSVSVSIRLWVLGIWIGQSLDWAAIHSKGCNRISWAIHRSNCSEGRSSSPVWMLEYNYTTEVQTTDRWRVRYILFGIE